MASSSAPTLGRSRFAVLCMFFVNGAVFANWAARVPDVQHRFALTDGTLGLLLLGIAVGVLTALSVVGGLIERYGSRRVTVAGGIALSLLLPVLALMPHPVILWLALIAFGMAMSTMDMAMNTQAVEIEQRRQKPTMSSFHAAFSIGGVSGAAFGAAMASLSLPLFTHFAIVAVVALILVAANARALVETEPAQVTEKRKSIFSLPPRVIWPLGLIAFCAGLGEGSMSDWSAVYLRNVVGTAAGTAALGFAAFSLLMTVGRIFGDRITSRFEPSAIVRCGAVLAGAGLLLAILIPQTPFVLIGFAAVGAGLSITIPLAFSAAGNVPGVSSGIGIAGVATMGYAAFLAGPPFVGLLADLTSLRLSLLVIALLVSSLFVSAKAVRIRRSTPA